MSTKLLTRRRPLSISAVPLADLERLAVASLQPVRRPTAPQPQPVEAEWINELRPEPARTDLPIYDEIVARLGAPDLQPQPPLDTVTPDSLAHRVVSGWGGVPGQCGVSCSCEVTYDGFDTIAEASALLDMHIAEASAAEMHAFSSNAPTVELPVIQPVAQPGEVPCAWCTWPAHMHSPLGAQHCRSMLWEHPGWRGCAACGAPLDPEHPCIAGLIRPGGPPAELALRPAGDAWAFERVEQHPVVVMQGQPAGQVH